MMELFIVAAVLCLVFAGLGCWIACQKGRDAGEGLLLGLLFGPLGCLIEAMLPTASPAAQATKAAQGAKAAQSAQQQEAADAAFAARMQAREAAERAKEAAIAESLRQEREQRRAAARVDWEQRCHARGITPGPLAWFWLMTDLMQAIVLGLVIAVPAILVLFYCLSPARPVPAFQGPQPVVKAALAQAPQEPPSPALAQEKPEVERKDREAKEEQRITDNRILAAQVFEKQGDFGKASYWYEKLITDDPSAPGAAYARQRMESFRERHLIGEDRQLIEERLRLAREGEKSGNLAEACRWYKRIFDEFPNAPESEHVRRKWEAYRKQMH